jgi:hypothetical protein
MPCRGSEGLVTAAVVPVNFPAFEVIMTPPPDTESLTL